MIAGRVGQFRNVKTGLPEMVFWNNRTAVTTVMTDIPVLRTGALTT